jgi:curli production assembly/transport component CsgE
MLKRIIILLLFIIPSLITKADVEVGGLLLDNTVSRFGRDFYFQFSQLWRDIPNKNGINVQIIEQVVPRAGTKLTVIMNHKKIYMTHMGRRNKPINERVEQAVLILIEAMAQSQYDQNNPDISNTEW